MSVPSSLRSALLGAALLCLALGVPDAAGADGLAASFRALPEADRISVQHELRRAELFLGDADGRWTGSTERALRRSVEKIAQVSQERLHPRIGSETEATQYLDDLGAGSYRRILYRGSLLERILYIDRDPVMMVQRALAEHAAEK
ncbi:hypothetical protein [Rhodobacter maris]|uniref:Uncharacterized protein n=1 Tax=Rhodobacter maris TaxID=446682 RepID=A0A285S6K6_9RHOB|nr:hypothetical protein [Rhodobacter maris]SOC02908.1 hypothetical protein SAMN05877831_103253 [Rhodobacter maris]